jgi:hypothetical protein
VKGEADKKANEEAETKSGEVLVAGAKTDAADHRGGQEGGRVWPRGSDWQKGVGTVAAALAISSH